MKIERIEREFSKEDMNKDDFHLNESNEKVQFTRLQEDNLESGPRINFLTFRLFSLIDRQKQANFSSKIYNELKNLYQNHKLVENVQFSPRETNLNNHVTTMSKYNELYIFSTKAPIFNQVANDFDHKTNELYSIFISMLTAAIFVFFIMWRWMKMKSDLRKALHEQNLIEQQQRLNSCSSRHTTSPASTSTNVSPASLQNNHFFSSINYRENLDTVLSQNNERPNRQSKQVLEAAKHCLQQLKKQSRTPINSRNMCSYDTVRSSLNSRTISFQIQPLIDHLNSSSIKNLFSVNEAPPSYESLMKKSSSLPSYYQLASK